MANQTVTQTVRLLQDVLAKGSQIFTNLDEALSASSADGAGKCWVVIPTGASSLKDVSQALKDGNKNLCVVVAADRAPVSQVEVLRAMEYGDVYAAAAELPVAGKAESAAAARLREAASFESGPAFIMLAEAAAVRSDDK